MKLMLMITPSLLFMTSITCANTEPSSVEVFVSKDQLSKTIDVKKTAKGMSIHVLDAVTLLENEAISQIPKPTNQELKSKEGQARYKARVTPDIMNIAQQQKDELLLAWQGIEKTLRYNIDRTPAVVINGEYIVYGNTVSMAVYRWKQLDQSKKE